MDVNLSIKAVPQVLAERLRRRAERHHRSLQGELMAIIEAAAAEEADAAVGLSLSESDSILGHIEAPQHAAPKASAPLPRTQVQGWKTVEQLLAERRARGWKPHPSLTGTPQGVDITRADRDSR